MKVAVIGRGFGAYAMKPAFEAQGWEVEVVPSRDAEAVARACSGKFDLVSIHSPPFQHRDHVLRALEAGRAVLCDKPFGLNADQAREMRDAAVAAGVPNFINFQFRYEPGRVKAMELLQAGAIGRLLHAHYAGFSHWMRKRNHGWLNDAALGGGWLGALGSHVIDTVRWHSGSEIADCGGVARTDAPTQPGADGKDTICTAEDAFAIWLKMANGATATLDAAAAGALTLPPLMQFIGTDGVLELVGETVVTLMLPKTEKQVFDCSPRPSDAPWPGHRALIADIEAALAGGQRAVPSFADGFAVAQVMDKLKAGFAGRAS